MSANPKAKQPTQKSPKAQRMRCLSVTLAALLCLALQANAKKPKAPTTTKAATTAKTKAAKTAKAAPTSAQTAFQELAFVHKSYDGFALPAKWTLPKGKTPKTVSRVVILLHGSGPASMDSDLTRATRGGKKNLLFKDVATGLVKRGFGVLRYHKRTYVLNRALRAKHPKAKTWLKAFGKKSLSSLVNDAKSFVGLAKKTNPKARVFLLGFSQGTYIALQAAYKNPQVSGVGLVGFYTGSMLLSLAYVQILYRPIMMLSKYDANRDGALDGKELTKAGKIGISLGMQFSLLDVNKDKKLSWVEIQGGNLLNLFRMMRAVPKSFFVEEMTYPPVVRILRKATKPVLFFQGMLDNQTPASHAIAIQHANTLQWKKKNLHFHFFPKLGHILDPRKSYHDLLFNNIAPKALKTIGATMHKKLK